MNRYLTWLLSHRQQFIKYFVVGISGLVIDMATLVALKEWWHLWPVAAVVINQLAVMVYNFCLNKYWSFKNRALPHRQLLRYLSLALFNYLFSVATMYVFNHQLGFDYRVVRIATIAVMVLWNFFLYKYWVYRFES
ncbi:MAG TPA: GtrA family protein [Patescibacteria group bacterium]|nr:GtrA family protein [Patescibacteria group bacterium]